MPRIRRDLLEVVEVVIPEAIEVGKRYIAKLKIKNTATFLPTIYRYNYTIEGEDEVQVKGTRDTIIKAGEEKEIEIERVAKKEKEHWKVEVFRGITPKNTLAEPQFVEEFDVPKEDIVWKKLLYSDFEDYSFFNPPPPIDSIEPLHWYLESPSADAVIDTTISKSGNKSAKLIGSVPGGSAIACGITGEPDYLLKKKRLEAYFMFPDGLTEFTVAALGIENFEEQDNVSAYIYITASGILLYATGSEQDFFNLVDFDKITLLPNEWYYINLEADFTTRKYISFDIQGKNVNKHYDLSGKEMHYDMSHLTPHVGIFYYLCYWCPDSPPSGHCWFDGARLFKEKANSRVASSPTM